MQACANSYGDEEKAPTRPYCVLFCPPYDAVIKLLLAITQRSNMLRFECNPCDGEIRCSIECPIEDGTITRRQFVRKLKAIPELLDD